MMAFAVLALKQNGKRICVFPLSYDDFLHRIVYSYDVNA